VGSVSESVPQLTHFQDTIGYISSAGLSLLNRKNLRPLFCLRKSFKIFIFDLQLQLSIFMHTLPEKHRCIQHIHYAFLSIEIIFT
jgi:hypothetical protein